MAGDDMARMKEFDVFQCVCGEYVLMGRKCPVCGRNYADHLIAQDRKKKPEKRQKKYREPAGESEFCTSFLYKKPKN